MVSVTLWRLRWWVLAIGLLVAGLASALRVVFRQNIAPDVVDEVRLLGGHGFPIVALLLSVSLFGGVAVFYRNRWLRGRGLPTSPFRVQDLLISFGLGLPLAAALWMNIERNILLPATLAQRTCGTWIPWLTLLGAVGVSAFLAVYYRDLWLRDRARRTTTPPPGTWRRSVTPPPPSPHPDKPGELAVALVQERDAGVFVGLMSLRGDTRPEVDGVDAGA